MPTLKSPNVAFDIRKVALAACQSHFSVIESTRGTMATKGIVELAEQIG